MRLRTSALLAGAIAGVALAVFSSAAPAFARAPASRSAGKTGYDVSYIQCGSRLPRAGAFAVVGVNGGLPWTENPCLTVEYQWAAAKAQRPQFYINTSNPETASPNWPARAATGPRLCANLNDPSDTGCAYNYGWNSAAQSFQIVSTRVSASAAAASAWWLDVETSNSWNGTSAANAQDIQGSVDFLQSQVSDTVGVYSAKDQWGAITGSYVIPATKTRPSPPDWVAGASGQGQAREACKPSRAFSGGVVQLAQYPRGALDGDYAC